MLDFLNLLGDKGIHFYVEQFAPDSMQATLTLVGARAVSDRIESAPSLRGALRGDEATQNEGAGLGLLRLRLAMTDQSDRTLL